VQWRGCTSRQRHARCRESRGSIKGGFEVEAIADFTTFAHGVGRAIEVAGICVIVVGGVIATGVFLKQLRGGFDEAYRSYRKHLGRAILLGLEFLVAADIIGTVAVEPTFQNVGVLGAIVLIRTFLSFALELEIEGRWPWQKA
jgi:uncharacterized membrane protein